MPNAQLGEGLLDYVRMQYENDPRMSDSGGLSAGQERDPGVSVGQESFGSALKRYIPGAALSALAGSVGGDDVDWKDALASFSKGYLGSKLEGALEGRKRKIGQEDFFIKEAYKTVQDLAGADLTGIQVPQHIKQDLADLHKKANEALMNDGVISAKEASTLLALAAPIKTALAEAKTQQGRPEFQAQEKEKGVLAGFLQQAAQGQGVGLQEAEEGDVLQGQTDEQRDALGRKRYTEHVQAGTSKVWPGLEEYGPLDAKSALRLRERKLTADSAMKRAELGAKQRNLDRIMSDRHFQARMNMFDARQQNAAGLAIIRAATQQAVQEVAQGVGGREGRSQEAIDSRVDEIIDERLMSLGLAGASGPMTPTPRRGTGTTKGGAKFTLEP